MLWAGHNSHIVHYPLRGWKLFNLVATVIGKHTAGGNNVSAPPSEVLPYFARNCEMPMSIMRVPKEYKRKIRRRSNASWPSSITAQARRNTPNTRPAPRRNSHCPA